MDIEPYLTESNWNSTGQKHVPVNAKTPMPGALKACEAAAKLLLTPENALTMSEALKDVRTAVSATKQKLPGSQHPKLLVELDKVLTAVDAEVDSRNALVEKITLDFVMSDSHFGKLLRAQAKSELSMEQVLFIEDVSKRRDPDDIYDKYIAKSSKFEVNITSAARQVIEDARSRGNLTVAHFAPAVADVKHKLQYDTLKRLLGKLLISAD